ncbi:MAG TPA: flagellar basal body rod protein FlgC [Phycisphaerae bacterium]|nr:flagellar basal body rod protein FlgC [Phycisphaerae bacterium]HRY69770.1 flagellar basal body rod protein FlgC [Phycisphaerae bacterium]HSA29246.1 flagellar basal body rod protein FlgC [Phycisphaerae bacterium]
MFGSLDISTSGLVAQRIRLDTIAGNIANAQATSRADGQPGPYKRRMAVFQTGDGRGGPGVHVARIEEDPSRGILLSIPGHPDAIKSGPDKGRVEMPNVDHGTEMINAMLASRAYEANITAMEATKDMISSTLRLIA